jgi:hypothetical protein
VGRWGDEVAVAPPQPRATGGRWVMLEERKRSAAQRSPVRKKLDVRLLWSHQGRMKTVGAHSPLLHDGSHDEGSILFHRAAAFRHV